MINQKRDIHERIYKFALSVLDLIKIFPNPTTGEFIVQIEDGKWKLEKGEIEIYNMLGERVYCQSNNQSINKLTLNQPSGIYIIKISKNKESFTQKLVLQK